MSERRAVAIVCMVVATTLLGVGVSLTWGVGAGLFAVGLLLVGVGVLLGWE